MLLHPRAVLPAIGRLLCRLGLHHYQFHTLCDEARDVYVTYTWCSRCTMSPWVVGEEPGYDRVRPPVWGASGC